MSNIALDAAPVCAAQLNHDQTMFAFATNRSTVFVFDTVLRKFSAKHVLVHDLPVTGLAFSPDSQRVLSVSADRTSRISLTRKPSDSKVGVILMVLLLLVLALVAFAYAVHHRSFDVSVLPPNAVNWVDQHVEHVLDLVQRLQ
jgi:WD40 repeat protein